MCNDRVDQSYYFNTALIYHDTLKEAEINGSSFNNIYTVATKSNARILTWPKYINSVDVIGATTAALGCGVTEMVVHEEVEKSGQKDAVNSMIEEDQKTKNEENKYVFLI